MLLPRSTRGKVFLAIACAVAAAVVVYWHRYGPEDIPPPAPLPPDAPGLRLAVPPVGQTLTYVFGLNDVPAATLTTSVTEVTSDGRLRVALDYTAKTAPALEAIWKATVAGRTLYDPETGRPLSAQLLSVTSRRRKETQATFDWAAGVVRISMRRERGEKVKEKELVFEDALDLPSAFAALGAAAQGDAVSTRVFSIDDLYEVTAEPRGTATVKVKAGTFEATEVAVFVRKVETDDDEEPKSRSVRVWVADDLGVPVRLEAQILFGRVYAELVSFEPGEGG